MLLNNCNPLPGTCQAKRRRQATGPGTNDYGIKFFHVYMLIAEIYLH
jgi:hypothetical protein